MYIFFLLPPYPLPGFLGISLLLTDVVFLSYHFFTVSISHLVPILCFVFEKLGVALRLCV